MPDAALPELTPRQIATLERFRPAGFKFVTYERYARYLGVEKDGFVALLDPVGGKLALFGQVGYRIGDGIGMLVERQGGKAFVCHERSVRATPELLAAYERFRLEISALLEEEM